MADAMRSRRAYGFTLVTMATLFWSTAGLFVRGLDLDMWSVAAWRALFAALSLLLLTAVRNGRRLPASLRALGWRGLAAVPLAAISMFCYVAALKLTSVANVLTVYATVPFVAAGLAFVLTGEQAKRRVLWASAIALLGIAIMAGSALAPRDLAGNALSLLMTVTFGLVLVIVRHAPTLDVPLINGLAALLCAMACWPLMAHGLPTGHQLVVLALFGFVATALGYLLFLTGGRHIPSGEAGLIGMMDIVLGPFWVWLAFAEQPSGPAMVGAVVVVGAVVWFIADEFRPATAPIL